MKKLFIIILLSLFLISCTVEKPVQESKIVPVEKPAVNQTKTAEPAPTIKCRTDADCGGRVIIGQANCWQGNPQGTVEEHRCVNPGRTNSYCTTETKKGLIAECTDIQFCRQGECLDYVCTDTDDGIDFNEAGTVTLNDGTVSEDQCKDETTLIEYYCSTDNRQFSKVNTCNCENNVCTSSGN